MKKGFRTITVPYGAGFQTAELSSGRPLHILSPEKREGGPLRDETDILLEALKNPIASPPLRELARNKKSAVIITSDHTRPVPSRLTIPLLLKEMREASPEIDVAVLIGVGCHRASTKEEMIKKFGEELVFRERIINHDPMDEASLVSLGLLPSGGELRLNRLAVETDLLVADGFIEPHQFAGFSGGRKSVLPGIAALETVLASHNAEFTVHPKARPGSLDGNPFQEDMLFAARKVNLAFILNVTLSEDKRVSAAFAGDVEAAHLKGCARVLNDSAVKGVVSPVVVTSNGGYPLDQNIYQSTKSIMQADLVCAEGGVIVAVNECRDGHGSRSFLDSFINATSLDALIADIESRKRDETIPDQWVIQLTASILRRRRVLMVTGAPENEVAALGMRKMESLTEALEVADSLTGDPDAPVTVLPDAVAVVIKL
ncbi:MAG: nickel-dependent lactate racemase [Deltaproteobacteria bacterium]|jgi:nickel-dependent lactate racemase|nr:nickel-dependent lactate racemase [Deltaproteobacteria bacterium]